MTHDVRETRPAPDRPAPQPLLRRLAPLSGAGFVLAVLAGNSLTETVAVSGDSPADTVRELSAGAASSTVSAGLVLEVAGLLSLVVFGAVVATVGRDRAPWSPWPAVAAQAAVLLTALKLASAAPFLAARSTLDSVDAGTAHALVESNGAAFVLSWLPMALLVGACATALREGGLIGRVAWVIGLGLSLAGLAAGLLGMLEPQGAVPVPFLLSLLWLAAVSVRLSVALTADSRRGPAR